jgi:Lipocalin-like domain
MKTLVRSALLVSVIALGMFSCEEEADNPDVNDSPKTELLIAKPWKIVAISFMGQPSTIDDSTEPCSRDNFFKFSKDGEVIHDTGVLKCESTEPQQVEGTWAFESNETKLRWTLGDAITYDIDELNSATMKLSCDFSVGAGGQTKTGRLVVTYSAQ